MGGWFVNVMGEMFLFSERSRLYYYRRVVYWKDSMCYFVFLGSFKIGLFIFVVSCYFSLEIFKGRVRILVWVFLEVGFEIKIRGRIIY